MPTREIHRKVASVVIPARDEGEYIKPSLRSIMTAVDALDRPDQVSVYVVDNGSNDKTPKIVENLSARRSNFHLLQETRHGVGFARQSGVKTALQQDSPRLIISTDADARVPEDWLTNWLSVLETDTSGVIVGNVTFPDSLRTTHPNVYKVRELRSRVISIAEDIFGVINTTGQNTAITDTMYRLVGPYGQPQRVDPDGTIVNLPGEDWDIGNRTRWRGIAVERSSHTPVEVSPRRLLVDPVSFTYGKLHERFDRMDAPNPGQDINQPQLQELLNVVIKRYAKFYALKPLLIDGSLIYQPKVQQFLGQELVSAIQLWIRDNPKPDLFTERNKFLLDYLDSFNKTFGGEISELLLARLLEETGGLTEFL